MTVLSVGVGGASGHVHWSGGVVIKGRGHVVALSNFLHHYVTNVIMCESEHLKDYVTVK